MNRFLITLLSLCFSGCASTLQVTYYSDPPGAVIYYDGNREGYAPQTFSFDVTDQEKSRGFLGILSTRAQWSSGAKVETGNTKIYLERGLSQSYTLRRPKSAPGRELDDRFSLELERTTALKQQAAAQERQAAAQERQAAARERQAAAQEDRAVSERIWGSPSTNCTSFVNGNFISTNCY